nr:proline dehydrogenase 1, mitochondrial [Nothobranchius furzeri]
MPPPPNLHRQACAARSALMVGKVTENSSTLYLGRKQYVTTSPPISARRTVSALSGAAAERHSKRFLTHRRLRSISTIRSDSDGSRRGSSPRKPGGDRTCSPPSANKTSVDFERTREAYRSKASSELLRSLLVFKLCSYDFLVDNNMEIMDLGKKILGPKAFNQLMKITFYGQFVAGEDHVAIKPLIQKNQAFGVGSVLDYSVEEDISRNENQEINSCVSAAGKESTGEDYKQKNSGAHRQLGDSHGERNRACTYFYADEAKCDQHMETFIKCIEASGGNRMDGFSAIKMTALGRPQFLFQFSEVLVKWQRLFTFLASQQGKGGLEALEQRLELAQLQEFLTKLGAKGDICGWFTGKKTESTGHIDILDWNSLIDDRSKASDLLVAPNVELGKLEPLLQKFTTEEEKQLERILLRLDTLVKVIANQIENLLQTKLIILLLGQAYSNGGPWATSGLRALPSWPTSPNPPTTNGIKTVEKQFKHAKLNMFATDLTGGRMLHFPTLCKASSPLKVTAEMTGLVAKMKDNFTSGLEDLSLPTEAMQLTKDPFPAIAEETLSIKAKKVVSSIDEGQFLLELVDMQSSLMMPQELRTNGPAKFWSQINAHQFPNLRNKCWDHPLTDSQVSFSVNLWKVFGLCAEEMALNKKANVMVASHNEDTVKHTLERQAAKMKGVIVVRPSPLIPGRAGFPVYKYVPYGPVSEVMPYLSRRAQENRGFMKGAQKERDLLWKELKRRLVSGELLYRPV